MKKIEDFETIDNDLLSRLLMVECVANASKRNYDDMIDELRSALDRCVAIRDFVKENG